MPHSDFFIHTNHHYRLKLLKKKPTTFDVLITLASIAYPLSAVPQAIRVFGGETAGVAPTSWIAFVVFAGLFITYGIKHRIFPMILSNVLWLVVDVAVVVGLLIDSGGAIY